MVIPANRVHLSYALDPTGIGLAQLPIPKESTVALLRKLGALEGKDVK
jgi:hypothetical protein